MNSVRFAGPTEYTFYSEDVGLINIQKILNPIGKFLNVKIAGDLKTL